MQVLADIPSLRSHLSEKRKSHRIVFVPTMGSLHDGHRACVKVAQEVDSGYVVVSIFVNPAQFTPGEDLNRYPRDLPNDVKSCEAWGCDLVFAPGEEQMYTVDQRCWVDVEGVTGPLCGRSRPGHFRGVATVVTKLFNVVEPDVAVFGQKDAQQALVIREMVRHLSVPVELRLARTARDVDGLAHSSRNAHLGAPDRERAAELYASLRHGGELIAAGERDPHGVETAVRAHLVERTGGDVEYAELRSAEDLSSLERIEGKVILAVAVLLGETRLIDNMVFDVGDGKVALDVDLF